MLNRAVGRNFSHRPGNHATVGVVRWPSVGDTAGYTLRRPKGKCRWSYGPSCPVDFPLNIIHLFIQAHSSFFNLDGWVEFVCSCEQATYLYVAGRVPRRRAALLNVVDIVHAGVRLSGRCIDADAHRAVELTRRSPAAQSGGNSLLILHTTPAFPLVVVVIFCIRTLIAIRRLVISSFARYELQQTDIIPNRIRLSIILFSPASCFQCFDTLGWEEHPAGKNWVMRCRCGYLCGARCRSFAYGPANATAIPKPRHLMPHLNSDWFTFLVSAYAGSPGKEAVKRV